MDFESMEKFFKSIEGNHYDRIMISGDFGNLSPEDASNEESFCEYKNDLEKLLI